MARGKIRVLIGAGFFGGFLLGNFAATSALRPQQTFASNRVATQSPHRTTVAPGPVAGLDEGGASSATLTDADELLGRHLLFPVSGFDRKKITDTFSQARGTCSHEAQDIMAPRGSLVVAVDDGVVIKLFKSQEGGLTVYEFDPSERYCYYYAHLDAYAEGLQEGMRVRQGDKLGYVGSTGNARTPHLHFAIFKLGPEKKWWQGSPINPYPILQHANSRTSF